MGVFSALAKANHECVFSPSKNFDFEMKTGTDFVPADVSEQEVVASVSQKAIDNHNRSKRVTR